MPSILFYLKETKHKSPILIYDYAPLTNTYKFRNQINVFIIHRLSIIWHVQIVELVKQHLVLHYNLVVRHLWHLIQEQELGLITSSFSLLKEKVQKVSYLYITLVAEVTGLAREGRYTNKIKTRIDLIYVKESF